jgi:hypothetical protein
VSSFHDSRIVSAAGRVAALICTTLIAACALHGGPGSIPGSTFSSARSAPSNVTPNGKTSVGSGWRHPVGVSVDGHSGIVYVADGSSAIKVLEPNGSVRTIGEGFRGATGVAYDPHTGSVYFVAANQLELFKISRDGQTSVVVTFPELPSNVAVDSRTGDV